MLWFGSNWKEYEHSNMLAWFAVWCVLQTVFMPFRFHFWYPHRPLFNECLQEFICFYARLVSLLMSLKAFLKQCLQGFISFYACRASIPFPLSMAGSSECMFQSPPGENSAYIPHIFRIHSAYLTSRFWPMAHSNQWFLWVSTGIHWFLFGP